MQKLAIPVLGFMPPVQSIADPTPRFTVDSARYSQAFLQFCIDQMLICVNPPKRQSFGPATVEAVCVRTHLILESSGTGTKF